MSTTAIAFDSLSREERSLIQGLREIPYGAVRGDLIDVMLELLQFVRDPRCMRAQADGVPCMTVSGDCEQCQQVAGVLARVHASLARS
jgi:hypothetical protein